MPGRAAGAGRQAVANAAARMPTVAHRGRPERATRSAIVFVLPVKALLVALLPRGEEHDQAISALP
jgi:hypothetical protein